MPPPTFTKAQRAWIRLAFYDCVQGYVVDTDKTPRMYRHFARLLSRRVARIALLERRAS